MTKQNSRSNGKPCDKRARSYVTIASELLSDPEPHVMLARVIIFRCVEDCTDRDVQVAASARSYLLVGDGFAFAELLGVAPQIVDYVRSLPPLEGQSPTLPLEAALLVLAWSEEVTRPTHPGAKPVVLDS